VARLSEKSDAELVQLSQAGDRQAFHELVERYQRKVFSLALGMLHNREDAWDVSQETFLRAFRRLAQFKGESQFYTWLYRIAVHLAIDFRRREGRRPVVASEDGTIGGREEVASYAQEGEGFEDPYVRVRNKALGEEVLKAINELTPEHKAVILLREAEGLSYEEIASVMQCAKGTVMSRLHYARRKLQARLKGLL